MDYLILGVVTIHTVMWFGQIMTNRSIIRSIEHLTTAGRNHGEAIMSINDRK